MKKEKADEKVNTEQKPPEMENEASAKKEENEKTSGEGNFKNFCKSTNLPGFFKICCKILLPSVAFVGGYLLANMQNAEAPEAPASDGDVL